MPRNLFERVMPCHRMGDFINFLHFITLVIGCQLFGPGCEFSNDLDSYTDTLFNLIRCHSKLFSPDAYFPQLKSFIIMLTSILLGGFKVFHRKMFPKSLGKTLC